MIHELKISGFNKNLFIRHDGQGYVSLFAALTKKKAKKAFKLEDKKKGYLYLDNEERLKLIAILTNTK